MIKETIITAAFLSIGLLGCDKEAEAHGFSFPHSHGDKVAHVSTKPHTHGKEVTKEKKD